MIVLITNLIIYNCCYSIRIGMQIYIPHNYFHIIYGGVQINFTIHIRFLVIPSKIIIEILQKHVICPHIYF
jgi:hypothetical protein